MGDDEQVARLVSAGNTRQAATLVIQTHGPAVLRSFNDTAHLNQ